jgi:hypothetical protein
MYAREHRLGYSSSTIRIRICVRPIESGDRYWVVRRLEITFGGVTVARKGVLIDASVLPGFVAIDGGRPVGLLTYDVALNECEVVAIISTEEGRGIGRALMDAALLITGTPVWPVLPTPSVSTADCLGCLGHNAGPEHLLTSLSP